MPLDQEKTTYIEKREQIAKEAEKFIASAVDKNALIINLNNALDEIKVLREQQQPNPEIFHEPITL